MTRVTSEHPPEAFNEKAALAELERLRDAIQRARRTQRQKSEEFDRFVRGFRHPSSAPAVDREVTQVTPPRTQVSLPRTETPPSRTPVPAQTLAPPASDSAPIPVAALPSPTAVETAAAAATPLPTSFPKTPRHQQLGAIRAVAVAAIVGVVVLGVLFTRARRAAPPAPVNSVTGNQPPAVPHVPTPAPSQPAAVVAPSAVTLELSTLQPVWMRVTVDGQKKLERMVAGGERLQFNGDRSIVVRAGNAGYVVVKTGTHEAPFGDAGQPLTRTFVKPDDSKPR